MILNNISLHPTSIVDSTNIGSGTQIWAFVHILRGAKIGKNVNICDHCFIEDEVIIGDNVTIKCGVWLWNGVTIESKVFLGPNVTFTNDLYPRSKNKNFDMKKTTIREGSSIGANTTILAGINIGKYAMIGANSLVTKNVGDFELVYGNPATHRGYICKCGKKIELIHNSYKCDCGYIFLKKNNKLKIV